MNDADFKEFWDRPSAGNAEPAPGVNKQEGGGAKEVR